MRRPLLALNAGPLAPLFTALIATVLPAFHLGALAGCGHGGAATTDLGAVDRPATSGTDSSVAWFRDVTIAAGITHHRALSQYVALPDRFSGGVCTLDVDGDKRLDLFFPDDDSPRAGKPHLYRQVEPLRFVEETAARGLEKTGPMRGCLAFDLEGDGDADLLLTGLGGARLFRNDGGSFVDVSATLGAVFDAGTLYSSAVAFDADGDGTLDLAIGGFGHYVAPADPTSCVGPCEAMVGNWRYGGTLLLLRREGGFIDATDRLHGGGAREDPALVLLATDLDEDGKLDLFVGNDFASFVDRYYVRGEDGSFTDVAPAMGVAVSRSGSGISSMSAFDADVDGDGHLDLVESSDDSEGDSLFRCVPGHTPVCADVAETFDLDLGPRTFRWGQGFVDFDHDGVLELFEAVGHYEIGDGGGFSTMGVPLLWKRAESKYALVDPGISTASAGRGTAVVDLDGDGDLDVVMGTALGRPMVLENVRIKQGNAIGISLHAHGKNGAAIGARVRVHLGTEPRGRTVPHVVHAGSSFLSSSSPALHVGVGAATSVTVDVDWPSGKKSVGVFLPAGGAHTIDEP